MPTVILSNGRKFSCQPEESILAAARRSEIAIEYSCQTGKCGACVAPVLAGETAVINAEQYLEINHLEGTDILTCQICIPICY